MNVLRLLKKDHSVLHSLFNEFDSAGKNAHDKKAELFARIRRDLQIHLRVEEEIFFPALKALNDDGRSLVIEALKEHRDVDQLLIQISRLTPVHGNFDEKVETLFENVEYHVEEEEGEIFRFAEENCSGAELDDLGLQVEDRKRALDQQMAA